MYGWLLYFILWNCSRRREEGIIGARCAILVSCYSMYLRVGSVDAVRSRYLQYSTSLRISSIYYTTGQYCTYVQEH
jgi:hypothetical protein